MYAARVCFKDVAVSMGIVPEDEHLLGFKGSGKIRRVGKAVSDFQVEQRVVLFRKDASPTASTCQTCVSGPSPIQCHMRRRLLSLSAI
ncbi:hypothetical protein V8C35DRAFT_309656 [Trichoderma chlorosporum]